MNVKEISKNPVTLYEPTSIRLAELDRKPSPSAIDSYTSPTITTAWQKDILLNALDKLENMIHLDNSHPLDQPFNRPIESFEEALIELSYLKSNFSKDQALSAQANINPKDVVDLFGEDSSKVLSKA